MTEPGAHRLDHVGADEARRRAAGNQRGGDDDVLFGDMRGDEVGLLRLVGVRHFLCVAARGFSLLELLVLDGDEFRPERLDLLLGRRAHVGRGDHRAQAPAGGDRLQAGDADAHDEQLGGRDRAGGGHHHRQAPGRIRPRRRSRRDNRRGSPGSTARPSTCARVMRGRSSMAKACDPGLGHRLDCVTMAVGVHRRDDDRVGLETRDLCRAFGRRTLSTRSAPSASSAETSRAPAEAYSASGKPALAPAPCSTATSAPSPTNFLTVSGVAATRVSPGSVSAGAPISIRLPPRPSTSARQAPTASPLARRQPISSRRTDLDHRPSSRNANGW